MFILWTSDCALWQGNSAFRAGFPGDFRAELRKSASRRPRRAPFNRFFPGAGGPGKTKCFPLSLVGQTGFFFASLAALVDRIPPASHRHFLIASGLYSKRGPGKVAELFSSDFGSIRPPAAIGRFLSAARKYVW